MVIYGEYLFLENLAVGLLLLYGTAMILETAWPRGRRAAPPRRGGRRSRGGGVCQQRPPPGLGGARLWLGGLLSGAGGFSILLPLPFLGGACLRLALSALLCAVSYGRRDLGRHTALFLMLTFLSGGVTTALAGWLRVPVLTGYGVLYAERLTYGMLLCCGAPAMGLCLWLIRFLRHRVRLVTEGQALITDGHRVYRLRASVDTGNRLRDPVTGRPVALVDRKGRRRMGLGPEADRAAGMPACRLAVIPYRSVGVKSGLLYGIRVENIRFGTHDTGPAVLAFYEGDFAGADVLLSRDILEGGVEEYEQKAGFGHQEPSSAGVAASGGVCGPGPGPAGGLYRRKRRVAAAAGCGGGAGHAAGLCGGQSGGAERSHRTQSAAGGVHSEKV